MALPLSLAEHAESKVVTVDSRLDAPNKGIHKNGLLVWYFFSGEL